MAGWGIKSKEFIVNVVLFDSTKFKEYFNERWSICHQTVKVVIISLRTKVAKRVDNTLLALEKAFVDRHDMQPKKS